MPDKEYSAPPTESEGVTGSDVMPDRPAPQGETIRPSDDAPPPMIAPARGPLDQEVPDVATGSTPLTRKDD